MPASAPGSVRCNPAVAADRRPACWVPSCPPSPAPVVDDEGLGTGGVDAKAEAGQLVVPGDPGLVGRLETHRRPAW